MFGLALATVVGLIPAMVHSASETLEEFKVDVRQRSWVQITHAILDTSTVRR